MSSDSELSVTVQPVPRLPLLIPLRVLALLAAAVAAYLFVVSWMQRGLPIGCGQGSGCDEVLRSRWSSVAGVPVGALALSAYLSAFGVSFGLSGRYARAAWAVLTLIAGAVLAAAAWFVALQLFVLGAICPWCMADHALGTLMAMAALVGALQVRFTSTSVKPPVFGPALVGVGLAGLLVGMQFLFAGPGNLARLPAGKNADTGPGPDRQIAVLGGKLTLDVPTTPVLGSPDAPKMLVLLFDYCCPHCRATHGYLKDGLPLYADQLGVVLLPMPLDTKCNPSVEETEPRFRESCDLIRLALAVWRAKPAAFAEFDAWLFELEKPRMLAEARAKAEELVGAEELNRALADPWIDDRIRADVKAYDESGADTLPVIFSPGMDAVVGRPDSAKRLFEILESELGLKRTVP